MKGGFGPAVVHFGESSVKFGLARLAAPRSRPARIGNAADIMR